MRGSDIVNTDRIFLLKRLSVSVGKIIIFLSALAKSMQKKKEKEISNDLDKVAERVKELCSGLLTFLNKQTNTFAN